MKSKPKQQKSSPPRSPQEKLAAAQADLDKWSAVAAAPDLSPQGAHAATVLARSAAAEVKLRKLALGASPDEDPKPDQNSDLGLEALLHPPKPM